MVRFKMAAEALIAFYYGSRIRVKSGRRRGGVGGWGPSSYKNMIDCWTIGKKSVSEIKREGG